MKKKDYQQLIEKQADVQRIMSKIPQTNPTFFELKSELKILGKRIGFYKTRPKPIDEKLVVNNNYLKDKGIEFDVHYQSNKNNNLKNILLNSTEIYELCLNTCKGNVDDTKDLYTLLTSGYDENLNDKSILKIKLNDGEDILIRILNYNRYNDAELKEIKNKLYHDYNNFNYEEMKQKNYYIGNKTKVIYGRRN